MMASEFSLSSYGMQVDRLVLAASEAMEESNVPPKLVLRCQLVIEELVTNAIRHGGATEVTVTVQVADRIRLEIRDDGIAFDPFSAAAPDISLDVAQRRIGGLGLQIIRSGSLSTSYARQDRLNMTSVEIGL